MQKNTFVIPAPAGQWRRDVPFTDLSTEIK